MKLTSKSISSPARTDKFPPPLMRFLRSNAGSRSRRSRSSPMFVLRKKNNTTNIETQEPSSPKVTCMGQVRAKRSSKSKSKQKQKQSSTAPTHYCWWIKKPNTCRCRPVWPKWTFFRRKPTKQPKQDSLKSDSNSNFHQQNEQRCSVTVDIDNDFASHSNSNSNSFSPPKNAFLLTRCRSAPYRSSSLASRFWSSPLRNEETESTSVDDNEKQSSHSKQRESISDKDESVSEIIGSIRDSENVKELLLLKEREMQKEEDSTVARAVVLTRCKSEPARTGYGVEAEVNSLWKKTRLDFAVTSSPLRILPD
uniref:Uncharacterized protein LOC101488954 isoform X1 n=1 Tax=Cicer arietinum TaxID=3827 RepID=A0A1S3E1S8_CICAR|nr:uncharacterized protein LOC101488954 isoform X2 [Cicer arietinum]XP_012569404.1 uncharacterized protein LOC101488954 isoform X1 [Cicer arietinum]